MPPLALTAGDPSGIGPEVAIAAWRLRDAHQVPPFYLLSDPELVARRAEAIGQPVKVRTAGAETAAALFADALPVVPLGSRFSDRPGEPDPGNAAGVIQSVDRAVDDVFEGRAAALVTLPIAKKMLYEAGFKFAGHTEYLAHLASRHTGKRATPVMMLAGPTLRTVPVTIHVALAEVAAALTTEAIVETVHVVAADLAGRFGIPRPRLVVTGLNPHAGEGGALGREEEEIIRPAVDTLRAEGIDVVGPRPADTIFHARARAGFDAAICMYQDQALIPAKTLAFDETVNVTLGLPFVRTSPDHGTAFDIAGKGLARADSLIAALRMAQRLAQRSAGTA